MDRHGQLAQQLVCERRVVELEVSLVVELEQRGRVGVLLLEVHVVLLRLRRGVAALLAHVHLCPSFFVRVCVLNSMDFEAVGLERAPLREGLLAEVALVGPHARVRPRVPL